MTDKPPDDEIEAVARALSLDETWPDSQLQNFTRKAVTAIRALDALRNSKLPFPIGARVRKKAGSQWQGRVVGYYSASRTQSGIAVEAAIERAPQETRGLWFGYLRQTIIRERTRRKSGNNGE